MRLWRRTPPLQDVRTSHWRRKTLVEGEHHLLNAVRYVLVHVTADVDCSRAACRMKQRCDGVPQKPNVPTTASDATHGGTYQSTCVSWCQASSCRATRRACRTRTAP